MPTSFARVTSHKKPRYQLYQPGFNPSNSCWLEGTWVTVTEAEFEKRKKAHEKLYKGVRKAAEKQHYRDKGVALKNMTEAQRLAWEHFSGEATLEVRYPNGNVGSVGVNLAGRRISEVSLRWLRGHHGAKVIPKIIQPDKKVHDQTKMGIPADLLTDDKEPVDVWKLVVKQNKENFREFSKTTADMTTGKIPGAPEGMDDFMAGVAVQHLFELEQQIIRNEISKKPDPYETPEESIAEYVEHRAEMKEALGEKFEAIYNEAKATHNECERANLDNSKGLLFCFVLPKFNDDGTHEPIGPRDFPWAQKDL